MFPTTTLPDLIPEAEFIREARSFSEKHLAKCHAALAARGVISTFNVAVGNGIAGEIMEEAERERMADTIVNDNIGNLMVNFPESGEMVIGSQNSISVKGMILDMKPMIKYWIQDYKEKMGYYNHSNLERVQYVCHDKNTRNMNEEERRQLNLILKSADEEIQLPYSTKRKKIDFSLVGEE